MKKKETNKRREFLALGLWAGAGALAGHGLGKIIREESGEKVKLITANGELVEVDAKRLPVKKGKLVSNEELKKWMEGENDGML